MSVTDCWSWSACWSFPTTQCSLKMNWCLQFVLSHQEGIYKQYLNFSSFVTRSTNFSESLWQQFFTTEPSNKSSDFLDKPWLFSVGDSHQYCPKNTRSCLPSAGTPLCVSHSTDLTAADSDLNELFSPIYHFTGKYIWNHNTDVAFNFCVYWFCLTKLRL